MAFALGVTRRAADKLVAADVDDRAVRATQLRLAFEQAAARRSGRESSAVA